MSIQWIGELRPDPAVRGVVRLREKGGARKLRRDLSAQTGFQGSEEDAIFEVVKQRQGERGMIRVSTAGGSRFHVKLQRIGDGEARAAEMIRRAEAAEPLGAVLPRPIAYLPRFRAIVMPTIEGEPILSLHPDAFAHAGRVLSRMHEALPRPSLERGRDFELKWLAPPAPGEKERAIPDFDPLLRLEIELWGASEARRAARGRSATVHGDFYPDHIIVCDAGGIGVLDWDNTCSGEAERDVGNFIAHLILEEERGTLRDAAPLVEAFCDGYRADARGEGLQPDLLAWYTAGSLLRLAALHSDPAFGSRPPNDSSLPCRLLARAKESSIPI